MGKMVDQGSWYLYFLVNTPRGVGLENILDWAMFWGSCCRKSINPR
jgi:hypothetical protein